MLREIFRIPFLDLPVYGFGLMMVIGCFLAIELAKFLSKRCGINPEHFVNIGIIAVLGGIVGARASHVLENWHEYFGAGGQGLWSAINIRSGGLTYYGGVILATPLCIWYALKHQIPIRRGMDIIAPALMVGLAIGRVGCFLNGCCYGAACDAPWAVTFPYGSPAYEEDLNELRVPPVPVELQVTNKDDPTLVHPATDDEVRQSPALAEVAATLRSRAVHPVQLYSTATALLICAILVMFFTLRPDPGRVFALMMMLEGVGRFTLETLRVEPPVMHVGGVGFSISMVLGVLLCVGGLIAWFVFPRFGRSAFDEPLPAAGHLA